MTFHEITVEDGRWARPLLEGTGSKSCEYSFVNNYMWSRVYNTTLARMGDYAVARSEMKRLHYLYPAGSGDIKPVLDAILADAETVGKEPVLFSLSEEQTHEMEALYPDCFRFEARRGDSDYLYRTHDLANLPGKRYQKKRNHCSRFERQYPDWEFHEITPDAMMEVCAFNNQWCNLYDNRGDEGIEEEHRAIETALSHYEELRLKGGYVTTGGEIVAFSFGSPLNKDVFVTHVEKALYEVSGAYNIINREMARRFGEPYEFINRENDIDEEGLREAKLSYHPELLVEKYTAELV